MKNTIKLFGIIALVLVISFSMAGCKAREKSTNTTSVSETGSGTVEKVKQNTPAGPIAITIEDPRDIPFLHNDARIKVGGTYEITVDAWFSSLSGTMLILAMKDDKWTLDTFTVTTNKRIPDFEKRTPVRVVFLFKPNSIFTELSYANSELVSIEKR